VLRLILTYARTHLRSTTTRCLRLDHAFTRCPTPTSRRCGLDAAFGLPVPLTRIHCLPPGHDALRTRRAATFAPRHAHTPVHTRTPPRSISHAAVYSLGHPHTRTRYRLVCCTPPHYAHSVALYPVTFTGLHTFVVHTFTAHALVWDYTPFTRHALAVPRATRLDAVTVVHTTGFVSPTVTQDNTFASRDCGIPPRALLVTDYCDMHAHCITPDCAWDYLRYAPCCHTAAHAHAFSAFSPSVCTPRTYARFTARISLRMRFFLRAHACTCYRACSLTGCTHFPAVLPLHTFTHITPGLRLHTAVCHTPFPLSTSLTAVLYSSHRFTTHTYTHT